MAYSRSSWTSRTGDWTRDSVPKRELYFHHTVTSARARTRAEERQHMRELEQFHLDRGWAGIGYHFVLFRSGRLYEGRPVWAVPAAQEGHNSGTVAIALVGNYEVDDTTRAQRLRAIAAAESLRIRRGVRVMGGHREAPGSSTVCPGKNVMRRLDSWARKALMRRV